MHTYLIYYKVGSKYGNYDERRILCFDREIESNEDIRFIEDNLKVKFGASAVNVLSFSELKKPYDEFVYRLDEEWN